MTTPPSKPDSENTPVGPGSTSSNDVLIFNNNPVIWRIFMGIFGLAMGGFACIVGGDNLFNPPRPGSVLSPMLSLGPLLFGLLIIQRSLEQLAGVEKLVIDFSQQTYHRCSSDCGDVATTTGNLHEVSHLCLRSFYQVRPKGNSSTVVQVLMVWDNDARFVLKAGCPMFGGLERLRDEMRTYAAQLAARLEVPVIEEDEA